MAIAGGDALLLRLGVGEGVVVVEQQGNLAVELEMDAQVVDERITRIHAPDRKEVAVHAVSVEGLVAVHVLVHREGVAVLGVEPQQGRGHISGEATASVGVDDAVVVVVVVEVIGDAIVVVVEGKGAVCWEGVDGVWDAVGIAVAQAAVLV